jgi:hypothetical protein
MCIGSMVKLKLSVRIFLSRIVVGIYFSVSWFELASYNNN